MNIMTKETLKNRSPKTNGNLRPYEGPLLNISDLEVIYTSGDEVIRAVNGISFTLNKGETLGLVGETGAGKTTTALSILRLLPQRVSTIKNGSIIFEGEDLCRAGETRMREIRGQSISMIFQDPMTSLNPVLTVGKQVAEPLELHNHNNLTPEQIECRVDELFTMVGIPPSRKGDYPHQFSGGMKQRVVIAIALACTPRLLIADEPTTALDVTIQAQVLAMMRDLKSRINTAMLLITHDLGVVAQTCDRVAVIYAGEVVESGPVRTIFDHTRHHPYTDGLFGSIPNLKEDSDRLRPIYGLMPDPTDLPSGCKFNPRCPHCMDICKHTAPPVWQENDHLIRCHLYALAEEGVSHA